MICIAINLMWKLWNIWTYKTQNIVERRLITSNDKNSQAFCPIVRIWNRNNGRMLIYIKYLKKIFGFLSWVSQNGFKFQNYLIYVILIRNHISMYSTNRTERHPLAGYKTHQLPGRRPHCKLAVRPVRLSQVYNLCRFHNRHSSWRWKIAERRERTRLWKRKRVLQNAFVSFDVQHFGNAR